MSPGRKHGGTPAPVNSAHARSRASITVLARCKVRARLLGRVAGPRASPSPGRPRPRGEWRSPRASPSPGRPCPPAEWRGPGRPCPPGEWRGPGRPCSPGVPVPRASPSPGCPRALTLAGGGPPCPCAAAWWRSSCTRSRSHSKNSWASCCALPRYCSAFFDTMLCAGTQITAAREAWLRRQAAPSPRGRGGLEGAQAGLTAPRPKGTPGPHPCPDESPKGDHQTHQDASEDGHSPGFLLAKAW